MSTGTKFGSYQSPTSTTIVTTKRVIASLGPPLRWSLTYSRARRDQFFAERIGNVSDTGVMDARVKSMGWMRGSTPHCTSRRGVGGGCEIAFERVDLVSSD